MKTQVMKIMEGKLKPQILEKAARILKNGGLVAFPTETVYGLGADALNPEAVKKIFEVKNRPKDDPLIVHVANANEVKNLALNIPKKALLLMEKFWPGPLTLVLKKRPIVPDITSGGLRTVAIRMPRNKIALELIKNLGKPIAAPSANLFGKPSPTCAKHVLEDLGGKIEAIIDGGDTTIGVESTVIDMTVNPPVVLRPGGVSVESLRKVVGKVKILDHTKNSLKLAARSPGSKYKHYAPKARLFLVVGNAKSVEKKIRELAIKFMRNGKKVGVMVGKRRKNYPGNLIIFAGKNYKAIAKNLFKIFRKFDEKNMDVILAESLISKGIGFAIMNRMQKASYKIINLEGNAIKIK